MLLLSCRKRNDAADVAVLSEKYLGLCHILYAIVFIRTLLLVNDSKPAQTSLSTKENSVVPETGQYKGLK